MLILSESGEDRVCGLRTQSKRPWHALAAVKKRAPSFGFRTECESQDLKMDWNRHGDKRQGILGSKKTQLTGADGPNSIINRDNAQPIGAQLTYEKLI